MTKAVDTLAQIITTSVVHALFGSIVIYVYLSLAQLGLSFSSAIDTATAVMMLVICIMVVRGISAAVLMPNALKPGVGLAIFWIVNGSLFTQYGVSLIIYNGVLTPIIYIACHSSDVGVRIAMSSIERWWTRFMAEAEADDPPLAAA